MALCDNCIFYNKDYDEFRQGYNDVIIIDEKPRLKHYCTMYNSNLPQGIWYNNADCPYYEKKEEE